MPKIVDHAARRAEITEVVVRLISEGGMEAATIREIANHSGYSKGVVEHYFDGKEELISAALELVNIRYGERAEQVNNSLRGLAAIRECLRITLPMTTELRSEWKVRLVFWSLAATDASLRQQQGQRFEKAVEQFAHLFQQAVEDGEIALRETPEVMGRRIVNTVSGMSVAALHSDTFGDEAFLEGEIDALMDELSGGRAS